MIKARKLPSGNYNALIYIGRNPSTGKREYKSVTAPTKREAELRASAIALTHSTDIPDMTLRHAYELYIENKSAVLSPSTVKNYKSILKSSNSQILNKTLSRITDADVQITINNLASNVTPKTVRNRYGLFTSVMRMFVPERSFHPTLPSRIRQEFVVPDEDTIRRLHILAKGKWIELPFLLASQCGLRASEIAGLKYECVDRKNNTIIIKRAVVAAEGGFAEKTPKTYAGFRTIPVHPDLIKLIGTGSPKEFVVTGGNRNRISAEWGRFLKTTDEPYFSFHKLRHYFASKALLAGVPKKYVAEMMGHASENMINQVYEHTFASAKNDFGAMLVMQSILNDAR